MARPTNAQLRINKLIDITSTELKKLGMAEIATPILLSNAITLALKTKGSCDVLDLIIVELQARRETIDDVLPQTYLSALVALLTKGDDQREDKDKSLSELLGGGEVVGTVKRV